MLQALDASPYLAVRRALTTHDGERAMTEGRVRGMLVMRDDFSQRLSRAPRWPATAPLLVNATDPNTARILESYVSGARQSWGDTSCQRNNREGDHPLTASPR
jgi:ABC-2 type transport system permease protein